MLLAGMVVVFSWDTSLDSFLQIRERFSDFILLLLTIALTLSAWSSCPWTRAAGLHHSFPADEDCRNRVYVPWCSGIRLNTAIGLKKNRKLIELFLRSKLWWHGSIILPHLANLEISAQMELFWRNPDIWETQEPIQNFRNALNSEYNSPAVPGHLLVFSSEYHNSQIVQSTKEEKY